MGMISQPDPVISANQIIGVLSPYYIVAEYSNQNWNRVRVDLWIWKGEHTAATSRDPDFVLTKDKLNSDDAIVEINIADYIADTINPRFNPFNGANNNSDNSFFYYEVRYFNNNTLIYTSQSTLLIGCLGWRYDYENFTLSQAVGGGNFPNGDNDNEFGYNNLNSKLNYFKYTNSMVDTSSKVWSTNRSFPISNITTSKIYYDDIVDLLSPSQIVCSPYNYGIGFINKSGNWDMFPIFGKVSVNIDRSSTKYNRGFRFKTDFIDRFQNSVMEVNTTEKVSYIVNTGKLSELMSNYLETIMYSPRLFIIDYDKNLAYPVTLESSTFNRKNITNDKNNIQHTLTFVGDNNKRLNW